VAVLSLGIISLQCPLHFFSFLFFKEGGRQESRKGHGSTTSPLIRMKWAHGVMSSRWMHRQAEAVSVRSHEWQHESLTLLYSDLPSLVSLSSGWLDLKCPSALLCSVYLHSPFCLKDGWTTEERNKQERWRWFEKIFGEKKSPSRVSQVNPRRKSEWSCRWMTLLYFNNSFQFECDKGF